MDLNNGAGGDYIYLVMVSQPVGQNSTQNPEQDAEQENPTYVLNMVGGTSERTDYAPGETVTVTAEETPGKEFAGWTATGIELDAESAGNTSLTFVMPANDVTLTATFLDKAYHVQLSEGAVFVDSDQDGWYFMGETVKIRWDNPEAYLVGWKFSQTVKKTVTNDLLSVVMPGADLVITAETFAKTNAIALTLEEPTDGAALPATAGYPVGDAMLEAAITWYDGETVVTTAQGGKTYLAVVTIPESVADGIVFSAEGAATVNEAAAESWELVDGGLAVSFRVTVAESAKLPEITASMMGNGSWIAITVLTLGLGACVVIAMIVRGKRKKNG